MIKDDGHGQMGVKPKNRPSTILESSALAMACAERQCAIPSNHAVGLRRVLTMLVHILKNRPPTMSCPYMAEDRYGVPTIKST